MTLAKSASTALADIQRRIAENAKTVNPRAAEVEEYDRRREREQLADHQQRLRSASGIPPRFVDSKLEHVEINAGNEQAVHAAAHIVDKRFEDSLAIYSNDAGAAVGNSKTLIASSVLNAAIEQCVPAKFLRAATMFDAMHQASKYRSSEDVLEILRELATVRVLVIDDLGRESLSKRTIPWLHDLFDQRWCECRPLVITSNLSFEQLHDHYAGAVTTACLPDSTADGIIDRLRGMIPKDRWIKVSGDSRR